MKTIDYRTHHVGPTSIFNGKGAFAHINDVSMIVSDCPKWTEASVKEFLEETARAGGQVSPPANIAIFLGDIFDAKQRKFAAEWTEAEGYPPAKRITMLSDSVLMRGAMTAYSWLTKTEAKAFASKDSKAMCEWITQGMIAKPDAVREALAGCFKLVGKTLP